jgi:hypothetical protein
MLLKQRRSRGLSIQKLAALAPHQRIEHTEFRERLRRDEKDRSPKPPKKRADLEWFSRPKQDMGILLDLVIISRL